jgi:hypothetical protein
MHKDHDRRRHIGGKILEYFAEHFVAAGRSPHDDEVPYGVLVRLLPGGTRPPLMLEPLCDGRCRFSQTLPMIGHPTALHG